MQEEASTLPKMIDTIVEFFVNYSFQVVGAIIVLIVGIMVANWTAKMLLKVLEKKKLDITLSKFLAGMAKIMVLVFAILIALGKFGITIAPFVAALGALAFGASFAIQGPLSNYGAGITIILTRPFVVGNTISPAFSSICQINEKAALNASSCGQSCAPLFSQGAKDNPCGTNDKTHLHQSSS